MSKLTPQQKAAQTRRANKEKAAREKASEQDAKEQAKEQAPQQAPPVPAPEGREQFPPIIFRGVRATENGRYAMNGLALKSFVCVEVARRTLLDLPVEYGAIMETIAPDPAHRTISPGSFRGFLGTWRKRGLTTGTHGVPTGCQVNPVHIGAHTDKDGVVNMTTLRENYIECRRSIAARAYPGGEK